MPEIGLMLPGGADAVRESLRGILRYGSLVGNWTFYKVRPKGPTLIFERDFQHPPDGLLLWFSFKHPDPPPVPYPVVNLSMQRDPLPFPTVSVDNHAVGVMAAEYFLEKGYDRFLFIGVGGHSYSALREAAFRHTLEEGGRTCITLNNLWEEDAAREALSAIPTPFAAFCVNDAVGIRLHELCREMGRAVPDDVAILGVDNDWYLTQLGSCHLSSINIDFQAIGFHAATTLDQMLAGKTPPFLQTLPPLGIVSRRSTEVFAVDDPYVRQALRYIHDHFTHPIGVPDIAAHIHLSRRALEKRFVAKWKCSPGEELRTVRLARVKELLSQTDLSIKEIAFKTGFRKVNTLYHLFRNTTGMTPRAFRAGEEDIE